MDASKKKIRTLNPASGQLEREFQTLSPADIERALERASETFESYRRTSFSDRSRWLIEAASLLENHARDFGKLMTREMGKPLESSIEEIKKCAWTCRY